MSAGRDTGHPRPQQDGVVLILVLLMFVLISGTALAFQRSSLLDVMSANARMDRVRAELLARSGAALATRALIEDLSSQDALAASIESPRDPWSLLAAQPIPVPEMGDAELRVEIEDAGQRISLNALVEGEGIQEGQRREFLRAALDRVIDNMPGRREEKRYDPDALADGIIDWIDEDTVTRLGDSEEDFYRNRGARSLPVDRPLFSLGELADVPGMDLRLLDALDAYFSPARTEPRLAQAGLNPNTAPPHVLALVYIVGAGTFLEDEEVYRVLKAREDGQIFCPSAGADEACVDFVTVVNQQTDSLYPPLSFESSRFVVRARARVGESTACIRRVLDRSDPGKVETLAYRLDC